MNWIVHTNTILRYVLLLKLYCSFTGQTKDIKGISIDLLVPGMMVDARVRSTLQNGILLSFLTYFTGTVSFAWTMLSIGSAIIIEDTPLSFICRWVIGHGIRLFPRLTYSTYMKLSLLQAGRMFTHRTRR